MTVGNITVTTADKYIRDVWSREITRFRQKNFVLAGLVKRFDDDVAEGGDTIHVPALSELSARSKSAGTAITYEALTETEQTISINKNYYAAVLVDDVVKIQARPDQQELYSGQFGYVLAKQVDTDLAALIQTITNTVGTLAVPVTEEDLRTARRLLDDADVPQESRFWLFSVYQMAELLTIDRFVNTDYKLASQTNGMMGAVYGIPAYQSNNLTGSNGAGHHNALLQQEALALAMQKDVTRVQEYSVDFLGWKVAAYNLYGIKLYRADAGVWVKGR